MYRQHSMASLFVVVVMSSLSQSYAAEISGALQTNPFSNPYISENDVSKSHARKVLPAIALELRGTMIAGTNSQANIGGTILAIGEDIHGYKLVSIKQRHVVLDKNGTQKTLSLDPDIRESGNE